MSKTTKLILLDSLLQGFMEHSQNRAEYYTKYWEICDKTVTCDSHRNDKDQQLAIEVGRKLN